MIYDFFPLELPKARHNIHSSCLGVGCGHAAMCVRALYVIDDWCGLGEAAKDKRGSGTGSSVVVCSGGQCAG